MMKLSEFKTKNSQAKKTTDKTKNEMNNNVHQKSVEELYDTYKDMNQDQLLSQLFKQVENQKKDGTFNFERLNDYAKQISPFLNEEQKNNLMTILNQIK